MIEEGEAEAALSAAFGLQVPGLDIHKLTTALCQCAKASAEDQAPSLEVARNHGFVTNPFCSTWVLIMEKVWPEGGRPGTGRYRLQVR